MNLHRKAFRLSPQQARVWELIKNGREQPILLLYQSMQCSQADAADIRRMQMRVGRVLAAINRKLAQIHAGVVVRPGEARKTYRLTSLD